MKIEYQNIVPEKWTTSAIIALCPENGQMAQLYPEIDQACPWLAIAPALNDFKGKEGECQFLYGHPDLPVKRVLAIGVGSDPSLDTVRECAGRAARQCAAKELPNALLPISLLKSFPGDPARLLEEFVYGFSLGLYKFTEYKTDKQKYKFETLFIADGENDSDIFKAAISKGQSAAHATTLARDLANMPGNLLFPETFALKAVQIAQNYGVQCEVFDQDALMEMGAGCLLAVGKGSAHPPRLVVLEYCPEECKDANPLVFVGKGITFDSGGLCLKPAANMWQMKCDMSGAAAVLAAICAASEEKLQSRIIGIMACAENMPDGNAYRPGDILFALDGQSVEVINTDAEGRLALADALAYAQKNWRPEAIIDIATLTGACAVALGDNLAGLFCADELLTRRIIGLGRLCGENFWHLPLWETYKKSLESKIADICHTASREGGAITAALFLNNFVADDMLWCHMDIAGVDWNKKDASLCPEGASGFGARALLEIARSGIK